MRLKNFQCFGPEPTVLDLEAMTYLLGPNGAGKTSVLTALARMFAIDPQLRRVQHDDFHVPYIAQAGSGIDGRLLWIEVDFEFPELASGSSSAGVPSFFANMRMEQAGQDPRVRFRLTATEDDTEDIEARLVFVTETDDHDEPTATADVDRYDRAAIQVHYLPARRDPADHIAHTSNTLLGRLLRAIDWSAEQATTKDLTQQLSDSLAANAAITSLNGQLDANWGRLHTGAFFSVPSVTFTGSDVETLLRYLNIAFDPAPGGGQVDWTRLSDGQQSLLYLTMVLALHALGSQVMAGKVSTIDPAKLKPASFTLIALEEPENSLSPHYLGRILEALRLFSQSPDAQAIVATHSPSVVRRVKPEAIRHLRLDTERRSVVTTIQMPPESDEAYKFVQEAVEAFPELYFARLVILGEGDSEQVVLPRMLEAAGMFTDLSCISVVPLGGRHVNHFWRLLSGLGIPYITLLDLDTARYQGGWGRVRYAFGQLLEHPTARIKEVGLNKSHIDTLPAWDDRDHLVNSSERGTKLLEFLESCGVYFSMPLDLDFAMLGAYPDAYHLKEENVGEPEDDTLAAVLGRKRHMETQYSSEQRALFAEYHRMFQNGSKPVRHLSALANLTDKELLAALPPVMGRLISAVRSRLGELPE
jgi:putative ATP-dependent endonuclease of the OLD family